MMHPNNITPSNIARVHECPMTLDIERQMDQIRFCDYAPGAAAHAIAALELLKRVDCGWPKGKIDQLKEQAKNLLSYIDVQEHKWIYGAGMGAANFVKGATLDPDAEFFAEHDVTIDDPHNGPMYGRADFIVLENERSKAKIIELKYGQRIPLKAVRPQLMCYALALVQEHPSIKQIDLCLLCPNDRPGVPQWAYVTREEVLEWAVNYLGPTIAAALAKHSKAIAGNHCMGCRAMGGCRHHADWVGSEFTREPVLMNNNELARHLDLLQTREDIYNAARTEAIHRIGAGEVVGDYYIQPNGDREIWTTTIDRAAIVALAKTHNVPLSYLFHRPRNASNIRADYPDFFKALKEAGHIRKQSAYKLMSNRGNPLKTPLKLRKKGEYKSE